MTQKTKGYLLAAPLVLIVMVLIFAIMFAIGWASLVITGLIISIISFKVGTDILEEEGEL